MPNTKTTILIPNEVIELVYSESKYDFIRYTHDDFICGELNKKIILYKSFDLSCPSCNIFNLELTHKDISYTTFYISISPPVKYSGEIEYEIKFNEEHKNFEIHMNDNYYCC